ncbi:hypothetical protein [Paenibacillus gansuensis]|uniref:Uncharacterized protein n=1 Tax=Paenibacillus gansuensis TaxID=306542 RepID=A0ABW5P935_9BACL
MLIKKKADIDLVLETFPEVAHWDQEGRKHYFVFEDRKRGGQWTLMQYEKDLFSIHGIGLDYADEQEQFFDQPQNIVSFLWENRSAFNAAVKPMVTLS